MNKQTFFTLGLICCCTAALISCGFSPLYATHEGLLPSEDTAVTEEMAKIYVAPISEHKGQLMRQELRALLSGQQQAEKTYTLTVTNKESVISEQGYREDSVPTRITLGYSSTFSLTKGNKTLLTETISTQSSYNVLQSGHSTVAAKESLEKQMLSQLAQNITLRVSSFLKKTLLDEKEKNKPSPAPDTKDAQDEAY